MTSLTPVRQLAASTRLLLGLEAFLFLAVPVFLLGIAWLRCGAMGIVVPTTVTILGTFVLLLITRSWGTFFLVSLPLIALGPVYAWYVATFDAPFDANTLAVLANSSTEEAIGFIRVQNLVWSLVAWLGLATFYIAIAFRLRHVRIGAARRTYLVAAFPVLFVAAFANGRATGSLADSCLMVTFPVGAVISVAAAGVDSAHDAIDEGHRLPVDARRAHVAMAPETHIIVIGESARFDAFPLNGYAGKQPSGLHALSGLVSYQRAYAPSNVTTTSVALAFTGLRPESYVQAHAHIGLIKAAREAGYRVSWLSNNTLSFTHHLGVRRDSCIVASGRRTNEFIWEPSAPDDILLPCLDRELKEPQPLKLIVLHTYGSHWDYANRLPDDGFVASGASRDEAMKRRRDATEPERINREIYDDTIAYTERFVSEVIDRARKLPGAATVTYFSDHGESFRFQDGVAGHAHPQFAVAEAHVPLVFWANEVFISNRVDAWANIERHRDYVFRTDGIYHTVASLMGIVSSDLDPTRDLTSNRYSAPVRLSDVTFLAWTQLKRMSMAVNWPKP